MREEGILSPSGCPGAPRPGPGASRSSSPSLEQEGALHASWQPGLLSIMTAAYAGFLTCVFESYAYREEAVCFTAPEEDRLSLWPERHVDTDQAKAERVYRSLSRKISPQALPAGDPGFSHLSARAGAAPVPFPAAGLPTGAGHHPGSHRRPGRTCCGRRCSTWASEAHLLQGVPPLLRSAGGAGRGDRAQKPGASPAPPPLLHPVLPRSTSSSTTAPTGRLLIHQPGRWAILPAEDFAPAPPGQEERDLPASVAAVL